MRWRAVVGVVSLCAAGACSGGSGSLHAAGSVTSQHCLPAQLRLSATRVAPGGDVVLSSSTSCVHYVPGKTYVLRLTQVGRAAPLALGVAPVSSNGSFRESVRVPRDASPGESYMEALGSPYDECQDVSGSCAVYNVRLTVLPAK